MQKVLIFIFLMVTLTFSLASALQIGPPKLEYSYEEGEIKEVTFVVINDENTDVAVSITIEKSDYADSISIEGEASTTIIVPASSSEEVDVSIELTELESFGKVLYGYIRFYQASLDSSQVGATVAVQVPIYVTADYPEKYLSVEVEEQGLIGEGEPFTITATLTNLGTSVITSAEGTFILTSETGETHSFEAESVSLLLPDTSQSISTAATTDGLSGGSYELTWEGSYDGKTRTSDPVSLYIGTQEIRILGLNPLSFTAGSSNSLTITLLNLWTQDLAADITVTILQGSTEALKKNLGTYSMPAGQEKDLYDSLDFSSIEEGSYTLRVQVENEELSKTEDFSVAVTEGVVSAAPSEESKEGWPIWLTASLTFALLFLIFGGIFFIWWFYYDDDNKEKKKSAPQAPLSQAPPAPQPSPTSDQTPSFSRRGIF